MKIILEYGGAIVFGIVLEAIITVLNLSLLSSVGLAFVGLTLVFSVGSRRRRS